MHSYCIEFFSKFFWLLAFALKAIKKIFFESLKKKEERKKYE